MSKQSRTKSALATIKGDTTTYQERSDVAKRTSVSLLMDQGISDFDDGVAQISDGAKKFIVGCNHIREAGRKFDEAEQIGQREFLTWHTDVESWKQDALRRAKIKAAQKVFHSMPDKAVKMADCSCAMQIVMQLAGVIEKTRRLGNETAHEPLNPFNAFVSTAATVEKWLREMEPDGTPIENYYASQTVEMLHQVELATRAISERHEIAMRLLKAKGE